MIDNYTLEKLLYLRQRKILFSNAITTKFDKGYGKVRDSVSPKAMREIPSSNIFDSTLEHLEMEDRKLINAKRDRKNTNGVFEWFNDNQTLKL